MNSAATVVDTLPLLTLAPVGDQRHAWSALLLPTALVGEDPAALARLFGEFGLGDALGELAAILPIADPAQLDAALIASLPAARMILLVPLAYCSNPVNDATLAQLVGQGFRLMVDGVPDADQLLAPAISAVASSSCASLAEVGQLTQAHLATEVADPTRFERCQKAGYRWFAGDYPLAMRALGKQPPGGSRSLLLRLLAMVTSDADSRDIEALLKQDPALSYHLLKLVNSVSFALTTTITSFSYAITLLGRRQLQRWLQLLLYAQQRHGSDASPLLARAARRASLMEQLSAACGGSKEEQDHAFMTGMFSLLDALFCLPLAKIVTPLHLADDVESGLLGRAGRLGRLLSIVEHSEQSATATLGAELESLSLSRPAYTRALIGACAWAIQVSHDA